MGVVSWQYETAIVSYLVHASSPYGDEINWGGPTNSCRLPNMHCGQAYNVTITAQDSKCDSQNAFIEMHSGTQHHFHATPTCCSVCLIFTKKENLVISLLFLSSMPTHQCSGFSHLPIKLCRCDVAKCQRSSEVPG